MKFTRFIEDIERLSEEYVTYDQYGVRNACEQRKNERENWQFRRINSVNRSIPQNGRNQFAVTKYYFKNSFENKNTSRPCKFAVTEKARKSEEQFSLVELKMILDSEE